MMLSTVASPDFEALRDSIARYPRMHGYYILDLVRVEHLLRGAEENTEGFLSKLFEHFDDQRWPARETLPSDQTWLGDYQVDGSEARAHVVEALIGGRAIGHTSATVPEDVAAALWRRFDGLFVPDKRYFVRMGLGDPDFVFQHGAAIVDTRHAGILWLVEND